MALFTFFMRPPHQPKPKLTNQTTRQKTNNITMDISVVQYASMVMMSAFAYTVLGMVVYNKLGFEANIVRVYVVCTAIFHTSLVELGIYLALELPYSNDLFGVALIRSITFTGLVTAMVVMIHPRFNPVENALKGQRTRRALSVMSDPGASPKEPLLSPLLD